MKKGFTMAECAIVLILVGFLGMFVVRTLEINKEEVTKTKFKNALVTFKSALEVLLTDPKYYPYGSDFTATLTDESDNDVTKFRNSIAEVIGINLKRDENNVITGVLTCEIMQGGNINRNFGSCFKQENGVIWGIPDTTFKNDGGNLVDGTNAQGGISRYLPITVYVHDDAVKKNNYFQSEAIILGVRRDGAMTLLNTVDCSQEQNKKFLQCKAIEYYTVNRR